MLGMNRFWKVMRTVMVLSLIAVPAGAGQASPRETVEALNQTLLETMRQADSLGYEGRYDKLAPVLRQSYDFARMARLTTGRHWRDLGAEERQAVIDAFARYSIATHASRFSGYGGEEFEITGVEDGPRGTQVVNVDIVPANGGTPISLRYILASSQAQGWQVVDVFMDNSVSELGLRRSEYTAVLEREGAQGLIAKLEQSIAKLSAPESTSQVQ